MAEIPIKSDRSARDSKGYPAYHATDLEDGTPVQHNPTGANAGDAPVWDGSKWVATPIATQTELETIEANQGIAWTIAYNEVTTQTVLVVTASYVVNYGAVHVTVPWDGSGATLQVGTAADPDLFFGSDELELDGEISFEKTFALEGPLTIIVTFAPGSGASAGEATIVINTTLKESL